MGRLAVVLTVVVLGRSVQAGLAGALRHELRAVHALFSGGTSQLTNIAAI